MPDVGTETRSLLRACGGIAGLWRAAARTANLMIGLPDYDTYVAHVRRHHPERRPMSREEFIRNRQAARYGAAGGRGCC